MEIVRRPQWLQKTNVWYFFKKGKKEDLEVWSGQPHFNLQANSEHERCEGDWKQKVRKKMVGYLGLQDSGQQFEARLPASY